MPIPFRADLRAFLTEFTEQHRGVRLGQMFGLPAGYVGRRLFACLTTTPPRRRGGGPGFDGIIVRLPDDLARQEIKRQAQPYSRRGRPLGSWVMYRPRTRVDTRQLVPVLEIAARHVAERQVEDMTGVGRGFSASAKASARPRRSSPEASEGGTPRQAGRKGPPYEKRRR